MFDATNELCQKVVNDPTMQPLLRSEYSQIVHARLIDDSIALGLVDQVQRLRTNYQELIQAFDTDIVASMPNDLPPGVSFPQALNLLVLLLLEQRLRLE